MAYEIQWEPKGALKRMYGELSVQEFMRSIAELQNDARFDGLRYAINDFLGVTQIHATPKDIEIFAALGIGAHYSNNRLRIAIVAVQPEVTELARKYAKMTPYETEFFHTIDAARAWLGPVASVATT